MKTNALSRRSVLLGSAGAVVSLPWLEAMVGKGVGAQAAVVPKRFFVGWGGVTCARGEFSIPTVIGPNYDLKRTLMPLGAAKDDVTLITDLRLPPDGAGSYGGGSGSFHNCTNSPLLSGISDPNDGNPTPKGVTSDQVVADVTATDSRFRSLEYRVQLRNYRENAKAGTMSMRKTAQGSLQPNPPQPSPMLAYDSLFTGFTPPTAMPGMMQDPAEQARLLRDQSVLDKVSQRSLVLLNRLGDADRKRMQRHYDEIRALELRISSTFQGATLSCSALPRPGADPSTAEAYYGDRVVGYSNERERAKLLNSLIHMAFTCDLTRTSTLLMTYAQCCMDAQPLLKMEKVVDVHELGHGGGSPEQTADATGWHVEVFAELVTLLKNTPEGTGTVLDNTAMVMVFEGGDADGDPHTGDNMWMLMAGGAGGLKRGHHVPANKKHPLNVTISAMQAVGLQTDTLGEISGRMPELFA